MPVYIRHVVPARWSTLSSTDPSSIQLAADELLAKGDAVSVFQSSSEQDTQLIAVAASCSRTKQPFRYIEITENDLSSASVVVLVTPGTTPLASANALHRHLHLDTVKVLGLVRVLASRSVTVERLAAAKLKTLAIKLKGQGSAIPIGSWLLK